MQEVAEVQATLPTPYSIAERFGVGTRNQAVPFHLSANPIFGFPWTPTAMQALAAVHDTPVRNASPPPLGVGDGSIAQPLPFQLSARVAYVPVLLCCIPTAMHCVAEMHETLASRLRCAPDGLGMDRIDHFVPFQCPARVSVPPVRVSV